ACTTTMIAPVRTPKKPTRSPVVERARHLLTAALWPAETERSSKVAPARLWRAWVVCGLLTAAALGLIYLAMAGAF
ncbi:MAG: hypothetical protein WAU84_18980, partial [Thermoguttaceae bacterium]